MGRHIEKFRLFKKINQSSEEFETKFWNSKSAESFYNNLPANTQDPMALVFKDAMQSLLKEDLEQILIVKLPPCSRPALKNKYLKLVKDLHF